MLSQPSSQQHVQLQPTPFPTSRSQGRRLPHMPPPARSVINVVAGRKHQRHAPFPSPPASPSTTPKFHSTHGSNVDVSGDVPGVESIELSPRRSVSSPVVPRPSSSSSKTKTKKRGSRRASGLIYTLAASVRERERERRRSKETTESEDDENADEPRVTESGKDNEDETNGGLPSTSPNNAPNDVDKSSSQQQALSSSNAASGTTAEGRPPLTTSADSSLSPANAASELNTASATNATAKQSLDALQTQYPSKYQTNTNGKSLTFPHVASLFVKLRRVQRKSKAHHIDSNSGVELLTHKNVVDALRMLGISLTQDQEPRHEREEVGPGSPSVSPSTSATASDTKASQESTSPSPSQDQDEKLSFPTSPSPPPQNQNSTQSVTTTQIFQRIARLEILDVYACLDGVDVLKLLRASRMSLLQHASPSLANLLVDEQWSVSICGPKHRSDGSFRVHVRYAATASRCRLPPPYSPPASASSLNTSFPPTSSATSSPSSSPPASHPLSQSASPNGDVLDKEKDKDAPGVGVGTLSIQDPGQPVAPEKARGVPGLMTIVSRETAHLSVVKVFSGVQCAY